MQSCAFCKATHSLRKEPYAFRKEPYTSKKRLNIRKRSFYVLKRDPYKGVTDALVLPLVKAELRGEALQPIQGDVIADRDSPAEWSGGGGDKRSREVQRKEEWVKKGVEDAQVCLVYCHETRPKHYIVMKRDLTTFIYAEGGARLAQVCLVYKCLRLFSSPFFCVVVFVFSSLAYLFFRVIMSLL